MIQMQYHLLLVSLLLLLLSACNRETKEARASTMPVAEYLAGIHLVHNNRNIPNFTEQAVRIEQLQQVTGTTSGAVASYLEACKDDPKMAMDLYEQMKQSLTDTTDTLSTSKKQE